MLYDAAVIGAGPAGYSAAVNLRARGKSVVVIGNPPEDNPLWKAEKVDNYLGLPGLTGAEMLDVFREHAASSGAELREGKVLNAARYGETWYLSVGTDMVEASAVILAAGVARGKKGIGEEEFLGRGVSYCATCDGMLYRGRPVAVLGYSETARREADFLQEIGCQVTYVHRPRTYEIRGGAAVSSVICDGEELAVEGVFILRPAVAPAELFPGLETEKGYVAVDRQMNTNLPGLFAAGDSTGSPLQVAKAVGEGLIAGLSAAKWLDAHNKTLSGEG